MPPASTRDSIQPMYLTIVIQPSSGWLLDYIHRSSCSNWNSQNLLTVLIAEFLEVSKTIYQFHFNFLFIAKKIVIEGCKHANAMSFTEIGKSKEMPNMNAGLSHEVIKITEQAPMSLIKFIIQEGWDDFSSVHSV